ncbi:hypothetical protein GCM10023081_26010 [Arthrobacter ginkgonis]|uniref:ATP-binding protein n=1 Tax=Arthrobacter ginkgonis TaxID=1630594 RepID=A0ABP7CCN3_9MICC
MTVAEIRVDQRLIGIDSRRFASIEKALVELVTNSDDSYSRQEESGVPVAGRIHLGYDRHHTGAVLTVTDQAEGMPFDEAVGILTYGGAHSPLSRGEGYGRGYFGRGLKQAIFGLGHGWIETIRDGRYTRVDVFRGEGGGYLYDDGGTDRAAGPADRERLGIEDSGTRVTIVVDNPHVRITQYTTLLQSLSDNIYLRDVLERRLVEMTSGRPGTEPYRGERVRFEEPASLLLLGPEQPGSFTHEGQEYPFTVTLKRAKDVELALRGDERTNGLVVISGTAALDCQLFDFENQVGTEYLFGTVRCSALTEMLGQGQAIISDEREGLNPKDPFVADFSRAVSRMVSGHVLAEKEKLDHLERATTSGRTAEMIGRLLHRMSEAAVRDLGLRTLSAAEPSPASAAVADPLAPLRFTTPFYYRQPGHPFHVTLLIDPGQLPDDGVLTFEVDAPGSLRIDPAPEAVPVSALGETRRIEWTVVGDGPVDRGQITARAGAYWAWCEIVVAEHASHHSHRQPAHMAAVSRSEPLAAGAEPAALRLTTHRAPRDYGADLFVGYEFRNLHNSVDRAVYSPEERKVIINTGAPTVRLYVDGRGRFRDSARLLLAELFMDVISDELARRAAAQHGHLDDQAYRAVKRDIIHRYGSDIHLSFLKS